MNGKTLKEIYDYDFIDEENNGTNFETWFNSVMLKTPEQLTTADICRMLRQKIFSVVAISQAIEVLKKRPFDGDIYEGQLMAALCHAKEKYLCMSYNEIEPLLETAAIKAKTYEWKSDSEKAEYLNVINEFSQKIHESREENEAV